MKKIGLMVALQITTVSVAWGAVWRVTPRIELKETYTDNVTLAPAGEEEWDLVTQINPGVSINGTGRRVRLNLNYRLQTLFYAQDSDRDNVFHQLGANAGVELVKERFFVNVRANVSQTNLFNTGRVARDNISGAGDRTDTASVEVEPIWRERWGGYADTELIYRGRNLRVDTDRISDGPSHQVDFRARNGRRLTQLTWNVDAEYRREERDDPEDDFERSRVEGETRFRVTRELYVLGVAGREESDFRSTRSLTDGNFWSLGAGWSPSRRFTIEGGKGQNNEFVNVSITPSRRSTLEVRYRDRSVGSNPGRVYAGRLSYRTRKARFSGSYNEEATTTQEVLEGVRAFPSQNPFGQAVLDPVGAVLCRPDRVSTPTLTDEVFVRKRFALFGGVSAGKKNDFGLTLFDERFVFEETGDADKGVGACASWTWRFKRQTRLTTLLEFDHIDFRDSDPLEDEADDGSLRVTLGHTFGRRLNGSLEYRFRRRESSNEEFSFDENRVEARIAMTF